jgi:hypothetical protein
MSALYVLLSLGALVLVAFTTLFILGAVFHLTRLGKELAGALHFSPKVAAPAVSAPTAVRAPRSGSAKEGAFTKSGHTYAGA